MCKNSKSYVGIDRFRLVASLLVIAIHTSPLLIYSDNADFILTRIIARVAVPFFFMTSGLFLFSPHSYTTGKIKSFIKKTALIYCAAIALYIPVNIYNGYFKMDNLLPNIVKDIVFDGTLYHLWYIPAAITGAVISWLLIKKIGLKQGLLVGCILYSIGLLGDSYLGLSEQIPLLKNIYSNLFQLFSHTRNGIFFAPVFFILGGIIGAKKDASIMKLRDNWIGFVTSLALMITEGLIIHNLKIQRHDSMYIMLIPCMFFLFSLLIRYYSNIRGRNIPLLRNLALVIYIIHPMIIIIIRMFAKLLNLETLLVGNSLIHFLAVSIASILSAIVIIKIKNRICIKLPNKSYHQQNTDRAWAEINFENLEHNARILQKVMQENCKLMAVVKADAYRHGAVTVAKCLNGVGVTAFAVATFDEAIQLRQHDVNGEILILGYTNPSCAKELAKYNLTQTLISYDYAVLLNRECCPVKTHIKIDTGMHRLGFDHKDIARIANVFNAKYLEITGIYTHLCTTQSSKSEDVTYTHDQIKAFYRVLNILNQQNIKIPKIHIQSSYGLLNYPELKCDYARIGIALYGAQSNTTTKLQLDLRPVLSIKSRIILINNIAEGESVGYDRKFVAQTKTRIAILPIGYADGFPRELSCGVGSVLINGQIAPIIGMVCMDHTTVDITNIPDVNVKTIATIIGTNDKMEITAINVSQSINTIPNALFAAGNSPRT